MSTCQSCSYFLKFNGELRGECYGFPPTMLPNDQSRRPGVKVGDPACSLYKFRPDSEPALTRAKTGVPSYGQIVKDAQTDKFASRVARAVLKPG